MPQQNFTTSTVHKKLNTPPSQTAHIAAVHKKENSLQCASAKSDRIILNIGTVSTAVLPPIVVPGMDPAMAAVLAMMQQNQAAQLQAMRDDMERKERRAERRAKIQAEENAAAMRLMFNQIANIAKTKVEKLAEGFPFLSLPQIQDNPDEPILTESKVDNSLEIPAKSNLTEPTINNVKISNSKEINSQKELVISGSEPSTVLEKEQLVTTGSESASEASKEGCLIEDCNSDKEPVISTGIEPDVNYDIEHDTTLTRLNAEKQLCTNKETTKLTCEVLTKAAELNKASINPVLEKSILKEEDFITKHIEQIRSKNQDQDDVCLSKVSYNSSTRNKRKKITNSVFCEQVANKKLKTCDNNNSEYNKTSLNDQESPSRIENPDKDNQLKSQQQTCTNNSLIQIKVKMYQMQKHKKDTNPK